MRSWQLVLGLGLLGGVIAAGCTVTSSDDDGSAGEAGAPAATGGSGGGSGGNTSGGTSATGGSAGATGDICAETDACTVSMVAAGCCDELQACTGNCATEFMAAQACFTQWITDHPNQDIGDAEVQQCEIDSAVAGGGMVTAEANALFACIDANSQASLDCTGFESAGAGGAGG